jgi:hypothetical protein
MHAYERIHPVENYVVTSYPTKVTSWENAGMDVYDSTGKGPVHVVQGNTVYIYIYIYIYNYDIKSIDYIILFF